jgi:hypothetical protein
MPLAQIRQRDQTEEERDEEIPIVAALHAREDARAERVAAARAGTARDHQRRNAKDERERRREESAGTARVPPRRGLADPPRRISLANSTIRIAFLAASPTTVMGPTWNRCRSAFRGARCNSAPASERDANNTANRIAQLVLRREHGKTIPAGANTSQPGPSRRALERAPVCDADALRLELLGHELIVSFILAALRPGLGVPVKYALPNPLNRSS